MKRTKDGKPNADPRAIQRPAPTQGYCHEMTDEEYRAVRAATNHVDFSKMKTIASFKV